MKLVTLVALILLHALPKSSPSDETLPKEFEGVWAISAVAENGVDQRLAKDPDALSVGEWDEVEILICENRIVIIKTGGSSMACKAKVLAIKPELKIEVTTGRCHDKDGGASYAVLKRNGDELTFAWVPPEMRTINNKKGGGQIVLTAKKQ